MVIHHRVEAGRKGAKVMWAKRRARDAAKAARLALWDEMAKVVRLIAHPKFTTDDENRIHYYLTESDVERARKIFALIERVEGEKGESDA